MQVVEVTHLARRPINTASIFLGASPEMLRSMPNPFRPVVSRLVESMVAVGRSTSGASLRAIWARSARQTAIIDGLLGH